MPRTVLIVDDNIINRRILEKILDKEYTVMQAANGQEALSILHASHHKISAVLLDIIMPVMDGFSALEKMQADSVLSQIPVIVITGDASAESEKRALALGANDFVPKPFDADIIRRRLQNLVRLRENSATINALQKDALTGLWNRSAFFQKAEQEINSKPEGYYYLSSLDIDNFKALNDRFGTQEGDRVLKHLARMLQEDCERTGGFCGRIAADNFIVLYPRVQVDSNIMRQREAEIIQNLNIPVALSLGRYLVNDKSIPVALMFDRANIARNTIKGRYDRHIAVYDDAMGVELVRRHEIENEMRSALATDQFEAWYQPQYNHATGALIGAEALARWRHPRRGMISPAEFVPIFERNGFIYELDKYIWERVCSDLRGWIDEGRNPLPVSVNISRYDLFRDDLVQSVLAAVGRYDIPAEMLRLEITESAFAQSAEHMVGIVKELISHGFTIEIDDFGSGYSSLNTLKDVPAQILKLDMQFMGSSEDTERGGSILESIVRMSKWLGMSVIAEGVEKTAQADYLKSIGCNYIQGYLYAKPMPKREYEALAKTVIKEERLLKLETVENMDNSSFWNPESLDTLIFNSYVGAACIFEYCNGRIELIRATDKYTQVIGSAGMSVEDALRLDWSAHLDEESGGLVAKAVRGSIELHDEVTGEFVFLNLPGCPERTFLRSTLRVIASVGERYLIYCTNENITAQRNAELEKRLAERKELALAMQMQAIMQNMNGGISAATLDDDGRIGYLFVNDNFYALFGYTREQFEREKLSTEVLVLEEDRAVYAQRIHELLTLRRPQTTRFRCRKRGGELMTVCAYSSVVDFDWVDRPVILTISTDITESAAAEQKLIDADRQINFLNEISGDLLAQTDMKAGIDGVLCKILGYFAADRVYIIEPNDAGESGKTYEVCADGAASEPPDPRGAQLAGFDFWTSVFEKNDYISIDDTSAMPDSRAAERELLCAQQIKSLIAVPFIRDGRLIGFLAMDNPTCRQEQAEQLRALGDYLAVMLTRRDLDARIKTDNTTMQTLMNDTPGGFVRMRVKPDGGLSTEYVNETFCAMRGMTREEILRADGDNALIAIHPDDMKSALAAMQQVLVTGEKRHIVYRLLRSDGSYIPLNAYGSVTKSMSGEVFVNIFYTELSAKDSKDYSLRETLPVILSAIMNSSTDLAFAKDKDFNYICCSPAFVKFTRQKSEADVIGRSDYDFWTKQEADRFRADDERLFAGGESLIDFIEPIPSDDGIQHYCVTSKYILRNDSGEIIGLYGCGRDVTDTRAAFDRLKLVTDNIPGGIAAYDYSPEGLRTTYFNDGFCKMIGCTREEYEELSKQDVTVRVFPEDMPELMRQLRGLRDNGTPLDCVYRNYKLDGSGYIWINVKGELAGRTGDICHINAMLLDVTAQMEAERGEKMAYQRMNAIMENADIGIRAMVPEGERNRYLFANDKFYEMQGYTRESYAACVDDPLSIVHPDDRDLARRKINDACHEGDMEKLDFRIITACGESKWLRATITVTRFEGEERPVQLCVYHDITQEKSTLADLRESEERFRIATEMSGLFIGRYDIRTHCYVHNDKTLLSVGLPNAIENVPQGFIDAGAVAPESVQALREFYKNVEQGRTPCRTEARLMLAGSKMYWCSVEGNVIFDEEGQPAQAIIITRDITEQREKEAAYKRWQQSIEEKAPEDYLLFRWNLSRDTEIGPAQGELIDFRVPPDAGFDELTREFTRRHVCPEDREKYSAFVGADTMLAAYYRGKRFATIEYREEMPDNDPRWLRLTVEMLEYPNCSDVCVYMMYENIDAAKRMQLRVSEQAETDPLTGVLNRTAFAARADASGDSILPGRCSALLLMDVDGFKRLNDTCGHAAGDRALVDIANGIRAMLRGDDLLGRLGGDEFLIALMNMSSDEDIAKKAKQICAMVHDIYSDERRITASIGIAVCPRDGCGFDDAYLKADMALYSVKGSGKDSFGFYSQEMGRRFSHGGSAGADED